MLYLNGRPVSITIFPDKTSQVWKLSQDFTRYLNSVSVRWEFENEGEFLHLAQLKDLLDSFGAKTNLYLPYLPYARQDKEVSNISTFALRTFAKLLNSLDFKEVMITDPHSIIALELIKNSKAEYPQHYLENVLEKTKSNLICYPDAGALCKYQDIYNVDYIFGEKVRDQLTGNITNYKLVGRCKNKKVLIVDDICDGGMTFKLLSDELHKAGAKEVNLFVSHGIFSKGIQTLKDSNIKRIFTKDGEKT